MEINVRSRLAVWMFAQPDRLFSVRQASLALGYTHNTIYQAVQDFVKGGVLDVATFERTDGPRPATQFRVASREANATPDGEAIRRYLPAKPARPHAKQPAWHRRAWRTIRIKRRLVARDLALTTDGVSLRMAQNYLKRLAAAKWLRKEGTTERREIIYALARDHGPRPPQI